MPLKIIRQDITRMDVDAIVNATNKNMLPGGGVDAAIHLAAGPELLEYCKGLGTLSIGEAKITPAFNLPCKFVIHTVGPKWMSGVDGERVLLRSCYREAMRLAIENGVESIAFPLIASGLYRYPKSKVLREATDVISDMLNSHEMDVYIVVYDKTAYDISRELCQDVQTFIDNFYIKSQLESVDEFCDKNRFDKFSDEQRERRSINHSRKIRDDSRFSRRRLLDTTTLSDESSHDTFRGRRESDSLMEYSRSSSNSLLSIDEYKSFDDIFKNMDKIFSETLFEYIDKKGYTDVEAYKKSNVSRKTFSKIKCDPSYKPSKITAVSFAIGLHLNLDETKHLLSTAGMCLSRSSKFDVIIEYFITSGKYETIFDVNEVLYQFDQTILGV
jgi:O-acetyl-ADP-ribose deacetylase (regulator of RNase III)